MWPCQLQASSTTFACLKVELACFSSQYLYFIWSVNYMLEKILIASPGHDFTKAFSQTTDFLVTTWSNKYIEDITCPSMDTNFIFESSTRHMRYRVDHEKIKFISIGEYVIFCLLYKHQWNTKSACFQRRDLLCNHNDSDLFTCEDMKFSQESSLGISLVFT